jgi:hypothetical protein
MKNSDCIAKHKRCSRIVLKFKYIGMTTKEIAAQLVAMNRDNLHMEIYEALYDTDNVVSVENWGEKIESKGMEAIKAKGDMWYSAVEEVHEIRVSEPLVADKSFAVTFFMDITHKEGNALGVPAGRSSSTELAVYYVNDAGKIYREEFFG